MPSPPGTLRSPTLAASNRQLLPLACSSGKAKSDVSAAVLDRNGLPIAAIHIYGQLSQWTPEAFSHRFGPMVINAAQALSDKH